MEGFRETMPPEKTSKHLKVEETTLHKMVREGKASSYPYVFE